MPEVHSATPDTRLPNVGAPLSPSPILASRLSFQRRRNLPHDATVPLQLTWRRGVAPARLQREREEPPPQPQPQPQMWTWEHWARHSAEEMSNVARGLEMLGTGLAGAAIGVTVMALPTLTSQASTFAPYYPFTLPLGAALGVLAAYVLVWKRWGLRQNE